MNFECAFLGSGRNGRRRRPHRYSGDHEDDEDADGRKKKEKTILIYPTKPRAVSQYDAIRLFLFSIIVLNYCCCGVNIQLLFVIRLCVDFTACKKTRAVVACTYFVCISYGRKEKKKPRVRPEPNL